MATPFPNSKIELHQWANSILLGVVSFFVIQTYNTISADHELNAQQTTELSLHELRIHSLEESRSQQKQTSYSTFDAILPDSKIKIKSE